MTQPPPPPATASRSEMAAGIKLFVILLAVWYGYDTYEVSAKESDAAFCKEWLSYYETLCQTSTCSDSPRKLAKCER